MSLPPANEVCEGYVFTGVCLSTGGHAWLLQGGHVWLLWGGMCSCSGVGWGGVGDVHGCSQGGMHGCSQGCVIAPGGIHGCSWGVCMVAPGGACMIPQGCTWLLQEDGHAWLLRGACLIAHWGHAWDTMRYRDAVNERAVCILLECILVNKILNRQQDRMEYFTCVILRYLQWHFSYLVLD